ncbi:MAG: ion channel, partial [Aeromicrobium sp.]
MTEPGVLGTTASRLRRWTMLSPGSHFRRRLANYLVVGAVVVLLAGGGFAAFESRQVSNYWEGVWWALSLMSTVGFVGEAPESLVGRLLSSVLMVSGF